MRLLSHLADPVGSPWEWVSLGWPVHLAVFLLVAFDLLRRRREPTSALLWLCLAWFLPGVGALFYLAFGRYRVPAKAAHKRAADERLRGERRVRESESLEMAYWRSVHEAHLGEPDAAAARDLNRSLDGVFPDYPLLAGNAIRLLLDGDEAYPRMLEAIRAARNHIHLQSFLVRPDDVGRRFLDLLAERARAGVTVRVLFDRFGSTHAVVRGFFRRYRRVPNLRLCGWTQANLFKRQFQVNLRNHRKLLVIDGAVAFTGGLNLAQDNLDRPARAAIRDFHFELRGPVIQELQFAFLTDWFFMTGDPPAALLRQEYFPFLPDVGPARIRVANGGPSADAEPMADLFFLAMTAARRSLWAVTPYFAPTPDILRALRTATRRGVDVRLVVPRHSNHVYAGLAGRALFEELLDSGVRIFERLPPFIHAKTLLVDDLAAVVGTANLDVRSLRLNYETNLVVYDPAFLATLRQAVAEEMSQSEELGLVAWRRRPLRQRLAENFCSLLTPVL
jgi:cardiolipin synthase